MGQKVNPIIFRIPNTKGWRSQWFVSNKHAYKEYLHQDILIKSYLKKKLRDAGLEKIEIERTSDKVIIHIYTSKPGLIIGRGGAGAEELKKEMIKKYLNTEKNKTVQISIREIKKPQLSAGVMALNIALDLEKRIPYRRAIKRALDQIMNAGAKGAKIEVKGRLDGIEIARKERVQAGRVPLQTIRSDIDYSRAAAFTTYGVVGVKVWIYKGDIFGDKKENNSNKENNK